MKCILLLLLSFSVSAQNYYMPKESLKNYLNIYAEPSASSKVICAVSPGRAMEHLETIPRWYKISIDLCVGYVSKGSAIPFVTNLTYVEGLAADQVGIHILNGMVYLNVGGLCYFIDLGRLNEIPIGKENAVNIRKFLDDRGGMDNLTEEIKENCDFH